NNLQVGNATGRAYAIREAEKGQGLNVVAGMFLINNRYASVLFDSGSDKSFVNTSLSHLIDIKSVRLNTSYEVELADGRIVSTYTVLRGCTLKLINHLFEINLMPIELGTFDIVIGIDWLVEHDAVIVYGKKEVHIPVKNEVLVVKGNECISRLKVISCIKAGKYVERGSQLFVAHVTKKEPPERRLEDVPMVCEFLEVFPDDLPGLRPP
ncbi:putative reverse transcriptase domain-containing protein, partial [Tanacetum coccineum]